MAPSRRIAMSVERNASANKRVSVWPRCVPVGGNDMGKSGRDILAALLAGTMSPTAMAELARGRMRSKREALEKALHGRMSAHHRMLIALHLEHIDLLDEQIEQLSAEIAARLRPYEAELLRLETIPGVGRHIAEILAAEMGLNMEQFPSAGHLASWAGMCPGNVRRFGGRDREQRRLRELLESSVRTQLIPACVA